VAALLGLPWLEWKKKRFAIAIDKNIENIILLKLDFNPLMRQNGMLIAKSFVLFHPHFISPAGLPILFCAGWKFPFNDLCPRLYSNFPPRFFSVKFLALLFLLNSFFFYLVDFQKAFWPTQKKKGIPQVLKWSKFVPWRVLIALEAHVGVTGHQVRNITRFS